MHDEGEPVSRIARRGAQLTQRLLQRLQLLSERVEADSTGGDRQPSAGGAGHGLRDRDGRLLRAQHSAQTGIESLRRVRFRSAQIAGAPGQQSVS